MTFGGAAEAATSTVRSPGHQRRTASAVPATSVLVPVTGSLTVTFRPRARSTPSTGSASSSPRASSTVAANASSSTVTTAGSAEPPATWCPHPGRRQREADEAVDGRVDVDRDAEVASGVVRDLAGGRGQHDRLRAPRPECRREGVARPRRRPGHRRRRRRRSCRAAPGRRTRPPPRRRRRRGPGAHRPRRGANVGAPGDGSSQSTSSCRVSRVMRCSRSFLGSGPGPDRRCRAG